MNLAYYHCGNGVQNEPRDFPLSAAPNFRTLPSLGNGCVTSLRPVNPH